MKKKKKKKKKKTICKDNVTIEQTLSNDSIINLISEQIVPMLQGKNAKESLKSF